MTAIQFFGKISDTFGKSATVNFPSDTLKITEIRSLLSAQFSNDDILAPTVRASINDELVTDDAIASSQDTIAFFSPFSGG